MRPQADRAEQLLDCQTRQVPRPSRSERRRRRCARVKRSMRGPAARGTQSRFVASTASAPKRILGRLEGPSPRSRRLNAVAAHDVEGGEGLVQRDESMLPGGYLTPSALNAVSAAHRGHQHALHRQQGRWPRMQLELHVRMRSNSRRPPRRCEPIARSASGLTVAGPGEVSEQIWSVAIRHPSPIPFHTFAL